MISDGGYYTPFTMRCDVAPSSDVRVRQALRYVVDREAMIKLVFGGYGLIGNDLFSVYDPDYDHAIPQREQDLDKARSLLKAAGHSNLHVALVSSPIGPGVTDAAQVFAQQASGAGITVAIRR